MEHEPDAVAIAQHETMTSPTSQTHDGTTPLADSTADTTPSAESTQRTTSFRSHARSMSILTDAAPSARLNRFSLQFPVQLSIPTSPTQPSVSLLREPVSTPSEPDTSPPVGQSENFLTAIAAQERKVLELKDELERAEAHLDALKARWVEDEAKKKREGARRMRQLRPIQTKAVTADETDTDTIGPMSTMQQEMERRKALLSGGRTSGRTVFSGSRHTRALSLLSPREGIVRTPSVIEASVQSPTQGVEQMAEEKPSPKKTSKTIARASTTPSVAIENQLSLNIDLARLAENGIDGEKLMRTGKKMASDLREGLWGIWEDLRQVTVGEEATSQIPSPRKKSSTPALRSTRKQTSRSSLRPASRESSVGSKASAETKRPSPTRKTQPSALPDLADPSFFKIEPQVTASPQATPILKRTERSSPTKTPRSPTTAPANHPDPLTETEAWEAWDDSPEPSRTSSAFSDVGTATSTIPSSPNSRGSHEMPRKDPIPWPTLHGFTPSQLKRTASNLMKEWERSLTPSPGQEWNGDYLSAGGQDSTRSEERLADGHDFI